LIEVAHNSIRFKRVGIIYGWGGSSAVHWQSWLARKCRTLGFETIYPKLSEKEKPVLRVWLRELKRALPAVDEETALVGHSAGCGAILHLLERKDVRRVGLVVLVAPLSLEKILASEAPFIAPFFEDIDFETVKKKAVRIEIFASDDDAWGGAAEARKLCRKLKKARLHVVRGGGHLNVSAGFHAFPEVLALLASR
jgi:predicted alpha/beta hydrolase family esterase